jgi:hypothetical protein
MENNEEKTNVIEMESETKEISKEDFEKISSLMKINENLYIGIASMEVQKQRMISQVNSTSNEIEGIAKKSMLNAGIPEEELEKYRVDIKTGKIMSTKDISHLRK